MAFIRWILGFLIALAVAVFAVSNRHIVPVYFMPTHDSFDFPLYVPGLFLLGFGFIIGALTVWLNGAQIRRQKRRQKKYIRKLEKKLDAVNTDPSDPAEPPTDFFPALPRTHKHSNEFKP